MAVQDEPMRFVLRVKTRLAETIFDSPTNR
jgi:hypothetical protein